ncbi:MAG: hypothetical protein JO108_09655 [Acidobacteriaceae bacterium]|nr:hypothetical protein [Acidobacteriaceae bacterium]
MENDIAAKMTPTSLRTIDGQVASDYAGSVESKASASPLLGDSLVRLHLRRSAVVAGLLGAIFTVAAVVSFPEADDGSLLMVMRELGAKEIINGYTDSPISALLWRSFIEVCGVYFWPMAMLLNGLMWACFGLVGSYLWIRMCPEHRGYAPFVACLTIAPVVVLLQPVALTVISTAVLGAMLAYVALFLILRYFDRHGSRLLYGTAALLLALSVWFGDYGLSIGTVVLTLAIRFEFAEENRALPEHRRRAIWGLLAITAASWMAYRIFMNRAVAHSTPSAGDPAFRRLQGLLPKLFSDTWHAVIGAYGTLLGNVYLSWGTKTLLISFFIGILFTCAVNAALRNENAEALHPKRAIGTLLIALLAGLTPAVYSHTLWTPTGAADQNEAFSRFYIPVMPVAACLTASLCFAFVRSRLRPVVVSVLALLVGYNAMTQVWTGFRRQHTLSTIGSALKPYVEAGSGPVVAVLSSSALCFADFSCTVKASSSWPVDVARRFWLYHSPDASLQFGPRSACKQNPAVHTSYRGIHRDGAISNILWVETSTDGFRIEPYCLAESGGGIQSAEAKGSAGPTRAGKGLLTGTFKRVNGVQDLSQIGTFDWEHWTSASVANHKASGGNQIAYYATVGKMSVRDSTRLPLAFTWSDGTPTESAGEVRSGASIAGKGNGFAIWAAAGLNVRTLIVYVGVRGADAKIQAKLTDSSVDDYIDPSFSSTTETAERMYKFVYRAGSPEQHLIVTFTQTNSKPDGEILLQAAALTANDGG